MNDYREPWQVDQRPGFWQVTDREEVEKFDDGSGGGDYKPVCHPATRDRIVRCVNLLQLVPDDAPCFRNKFQSDEVLLALSVLAGDHGSAACLADEIITKYTRPDPPPSSKARVGGESGYLETEQRTWNRLFERGGLRRLLVRQRVFRRAEGVWTLMWVAENQTDPTPVWCDFDPRDPEGLNAAKKEVSAAFDAYHGLAPAVRPEPVPPPPDPGRSRLDLRRGQEPRWVPHEENGDL